MKKFLCLLGLVALLTVLAGCSSQGIDDSYAAYRNQTASQLYHAGTNDLKKKHYDKASKKLEALNALYPFGVYAQQGQVNLIYAYYKDDESDEALAIADRYLRLYPQGRYAAYVYYMKGVIAFTHGYTWLQRKFAVNPAPRDITGMKRAYLDFDQLVRMYPRSPYTPDAIVRMRYIRNLVAEKNLEIAKFYYERKAYVASANRASYIVTHLAKTPSVIPALALMVKSYRHLKLPKMANNTLKILEASYPHSKALHKLMHHS